MGIAGGKGTKRFTIEVSPIIAVKRGSSLTKAATLATTFWAGLKEAPLRRCKYVFSMKDLLQARGITVSLIMT